MGKKIILTGGGTAGHATPNIALIPELRRRGFEILYIGSYEGIEKELITETGVEYRAVPSGKLRRYFDLKNFTDPFRVIMGYLRSAKIVKEFKPDIVFSKGGFVAVPVTFAAKRYGIPVVLHESDMTPGLANRLAAPSADRICCNFPETMEKLPKEKAVLTGTPIRRELLRGEKSEGISLLGFSGEKPVLLVIGGSLGAVRINDEVRKVLDALLSKFDIVHICGKGHIETELSDKAGYRQFEYVDKELKDCFAAADLVVSRAGANSICELLALRRPNLLIPLSLDASRGDQILNAASFERQGFSKVLREEDMTDETFLSAVDEVYRDRESYIRRMEASPLSDGVASVMEVIEGALKG